MRFEGFLEASKNEPFYVNKQQLEHLFLVVIYHLENTMEISYIVVVSQVVVTMIMVWWDMEDVPFIPYDLLECSHVLMDNTLVFHHK
jgi:hypothetical protein